jgi:hypothetical protein
VGARDTRYPRVTLDEVVERQPEVVLLPDEPHPFSDADAEVFRALDIPAARAGRVLRVDGKALCWYSPRLIDALPQVRAWLHPDERRAAPDGAASEGVTGDPPSSRDTTVAPRGRGPMSKTPPKVRDARFRDRPSRGPTPPKEPLRANPARRGA